MYMYLILPTMHNILKLCIIIEKYMYFLLKGLFLLFLTFYRNITVTSSKQNLTNVMLGSNFNWNFVVCWSAITNFKILRELVLGENDIKDSLV